CPNCGELRVSHRVCPSCGYYNGKQVVKVNN
ncbi:MAG: 50S ribosomal protein L32, partial [Lactiplantibacillus plantarum]